MRFSTHAFGCRINQAEIEEITRLMTKRGFLYDQKNPDVFVINTCSVTHKAEREARQLIYRLKKNNPRLKIVVTGCSATYWQKNNLFQNLPIDLSVNNLNKQFLVEILTNKLFKKFGSCSKMSNFELKNKFLDSGRFLLKIQEGCHRFCTFCIVPYLRSQPKSIKVKELIKKIRLIKNDVKEVILTAINTESYGKDTDETLVNLINTLFNKTAIPRFSFGSLHPWSIDKNFIDCYRKILSKKRLVNFFHIPLQSGSDKILNLMKRGYSQEEFSEKINMIASVNPLAFIATDVIVGFLDETEKDFEETYDFLKTSPISKFHIFRFSKRKNTAAYFMSSKLEEPSETVKKQRAKALQDLSEKKLTVFKNSLVSYKSAVLFLKKRIENFQEGLLDNQIPVLVKTNKNLIGQIRNIKIIELKNEKLFGRII